MGSIFSGPKVPKVQDPNIISEEEKKRLSEEDRKKRRTQRGRGASLLTDPQGVQGDDIGGLAVKKLLGGS